MATGLFSIRDDRRGGPRRGYMPMNRRSPWSRSMDDRLMELVSTDAVSFGEIAHILGLTRNQVVSRFYWLKRQMGWQAC